MTISRRLAVLLGAFTLLAAVGASAAVSNDPARARANSCTPLMAGLRVTALEPHLTEPWGVTFRGEVRTTKDVCLDEAKIIGERKVCGALGCNYHEVVESDWKWVEGTSLDLSIEGPCKRGKHRYRTHVIYCAHQAFNQCRTTTHWRDSDNLDCQS
jgi:hypothetical protein